MKNDTFSSSDIEFGNSNNANSYVVTPGGYLRYIAKGYSPPVSGVVPVQDTRLVTNKMPKQH